MINSEYRDPTVFDKIYRSNRMIWNDNMCKKKILPETFNQVRAIYDDIANDLYLDNTDDLLTIMISRSHPNIDEHEISTSYMNKCQGLHQAHAPAKF